MLMQCPECELQVSDKATFCPHCGPDRSLWISNTAGRKTEKTPKQK